MNRQVKRQMAKQGADTPNAPDKRAPDGEHADRAHHARARTCSEVQGEMKRVAWPPRSEIMNSTVIVIIGVVVMTALIFLFDYLANNAVDDDLLVMSDTFDPSRDPARRRRERSRPRRHGRRSDRG